MAVQKRNSEMVDLLRADFIHKNDTAYGWAMLNQMYTTIPGITGFWSMAAISKEDTSQQFTGWDDLPNLVGLWTMSEISQEDLSYRWVSTLDLMNELPGVIGLWEMGAISKDDKIYLGNQTWYDLTNEQLFVYGTGITSDARLVVGRGSGGEGTAVMVGTTYRSHFNYSAAENTYIRGGKLGSSVYIQDNAIGDVNICDGGGIISSNLGILGMAWISLPLTNSGGTTWANFGAPYQTAQYKRLGDIVWVRGLVTRTAGAGPTIAQLPALFRPPVQIIRQVISNELNARLDIDTTGNIITDASYNSWMEISFSFSTAS